jgi:uncharacterized phage protein (TIGR02218 family)
MNFTKLIQCFEIERSDGVILYFNQSNENIFFDGKNYIASMIKSKNKKYFSNSAKDGGFFDSEIELGIENDLISRDDIRFGLYKDAKIETFFIDQFDNIKKFLHRGFVSNIKILDDDQFLFEIKSLIEILDVNLNQKYSLNCRADFGDQKCRVDLKNYFYYGFITKINNEKSFIDSASNFENGYFENGNIIFFDDEQRKIKTKIEFFMNNTFEIIFVPFLELKIGMRFLAIPGCNKTIGMCSKRYKNSINFRGEPFLPGFEKF